MISVHFFQPSASRKNADRSVITQSDPATASASSAVGDGACAATARGGADRGGRGGAVTKPSTFSGGVSGVPVLRTCLSPCSIQPCSARSDSSPSLSTASRVVRRLLPVHRGRLGHRAGSPPIPAPRRARSDERRAGRHDRARGQRHPRRPAGPSRAGGHGGGAGGRDHGADDRGRPAPLHRGPARSSGEPATPAQREAGPKPGWVSAAYPLDRYRDALDHAAEAGRRGAAKIAFDMRQERRRGIL